MRICTFAPLGHQQDHKERLKIQKTMSEKNVPEVLLRIFVFVPKLS